MPSTSCFEAPQPGVLVSSGIELVDLDQDAEISRHFYLPTAMVFGRHGAQAVSRGAVAREYGRAEWGTSLRFEYRESHPVSMERTRPMPGDLDADGDLDIVVASCIADQSARWEDLPPSGLDLARKTTASSASRATRLPAIRPIFVTADLGDLDGRWAAGYHHRGDAHFFRRWPPPDHLGRVSLWLNRLGRGWTGWGGKGGEQDFMGFV